MRIGIEEEEDLDEEEIRISPVLQTPSYKHLPVAR